MAFREPAGVGGAAIRHLCGPAELDPAGIDKES
jgi:hypothetical protein